MSSQILQGKRALITHADAFMGPIPCEVFANHGATVVLSSNNLLSADAPGVIVAEAGPLDILVANLAIPAPDTAATEVPDEESNDTFAAYLCSEPASCFVGQVIPFCGGWGGALVQTMLNPSIHRTVKKLRFLPLGHLQR